MFRKILRFQKPAISRIAAPYLLSAIPLLWVNFAIYSAQALAQSVHSPSTSSESNTAESTSIEATPPQPKEPRQTPSTRTPVRYIPPDFFSDVGRPTDRTGGGSRGSCSPPGRSPLTALVPNNSLGLTLSGSPSFWFYIPYTLSSDQLIEFVLKNEHDNIIYTTKSVGAGIAPGITSLHLPSDVVLEIDSNYEWYFLVYCDAHNLERFVYVNGVIRRVERPDLESRLASTPSQDHAGLYAGEGIWYDALTQLVEQYRSTTWDDQLSGNWLNFLQSVGLEHLASASFIECCSAE